MLPFTRVVSIRWSLLRNLLLLIVLLSGSLLVTTILGAREVVRELASTLIDRTERVTESELNRFLVPAARSLSVIREWIGAGELDTGDVEDFVRFFQPLLRQFRQVTSVNSGDDAGNGILLLRLVAEGGGWRTREVRPAEWGRRTRYTTRSDEGKMLEEWWEETDYDPRERPWFLPRGADSGGEVRWTDPYLFFSTHEPGLTASIAAPVGGGDGAGRVVIALDVRLEDVSALTTELSPSTHGIAFVLSERGEAVGLPRDPSFATPEARREAILKLGSELGVPSMRDGALEWRRRAGLGPDDPIGAGRFDQGTVFDFESGGENHWAAVRLLPLDIDTALIIGVGIPERDLFSDADRQRVALLLATVAAVGLAVAMALILSRGYSRPLKTLVRQSERLRELDTDPIEPPHSRLREVVKLSEAQELTRAALESFKRYMPVDVVRELVRRGTAARIGGEVQPLSILFSDIRNFTTIAESMEPEALTAHVADYFDTMVEILSANGGTIDKFIGDAVVTFWGAPSPDPVHSFHAVRTALLCRDRIVERNAEWKARGLPLLHTRFGVATGRTLVGNVGSPRRLSYTVLGDTANVASRLQDVNRHYGTEILASEPVRDATAGEVAYRRVDVAALRGKHSIVTLYEPLGLAGAVPAERLELARGYEAALDLYRAKSLGAAVESLLALEARFAEDGPTKWLRKKCEALLADGALPDDWDGVTRFG